MVFTEGVKEAELEKELLRLLELAEIYARRELVITSGDRAESTRCHGEARAVDIRCWDSDDRFRIVSGLIKAGVQRIGVYTRHIHADVCTKGRYPEGVLWLGGASK